MAIANSLSNRFKKAIMNKEVDMDTDVFKMALMNTSFAFDPASDALWSDVSSMEIAAGNGYTAGGQVLASGELTQDNVANKGIMKWQNCNWQAVGGDIADTGSAIIYDDTHANKIIVGCSDYGVNYQTIENSWLKFLEVIISLG